MLVCIHMDAFAHYVCRYMNTKQVFNNVIFIAKLKLCSAIERFNDCLHTLLRVFPI